MLKENEKTVQQIEQIQKGLIGDNVLFARGSGKTNQITMRLKLYSAYEFMKNHVINLDKFVSIDNINNMIKNAWLKAEGEEVESSE